MPDIQSGVRFANSARTEQPGSGIWGKVLGNNRIFAENVGEMVGKGLGCLDGDRYSGREGRSF